MFWPTTNIFTKPLASLTLGEILHTAGFIAMAVLLASGLFNPNDDPEIRKAWAALGVLLIVGAVVLVYFAR